MPDLTRYLQRVSFLLRQGEPGGGRRRLPADERRVGPLHAGAREPVRGVARPHRPGSAGHHQRGWLRIRPVRRRGARAQSGAWMGTGSCSARSPTALVILPGVERMPPATMRTLEAFARAGGHRRRHAAHSGSRAGPAGDRPTSTPRCGTRRRVCFSRPASPGTSSPDEREALPDDAARLAARPTCGSHLRRRRSASCTGGSRSRMCYFVANTSNVAVRTERRVSRGTPERGDRGTR